MFSAKKQGLDLIDPCCLVAAYSSSFEVLGKR